MRSKAVSGILLILLLVGILTLVFNIQSTEAEPEPLTLETDKDFYFLGENVKIILTNVSNETVLIGGYPPYAIYKYRLEPVWPKIFAWLLWELDPGENDTIVWGQYNAYTNSSVEPGEYYVEDHTGEASPQKVFFNIYSPAVGGIYISTDKLSLLAPHIGLTILVAVAVATVVYVKKRNNKFEN